MKKILILALGGSLAVSISQAQSGASSQSTSSASQDTSMSAGQSGAQADSKTAVGAQQQGKVAEGAAPSAASGQLASGSMIYAELSKSVDAKKAKQGDEVTAKTQQAVLSQGKVLMPKGSKLIGHVTTVKPHEKDKPQSELGIVFDHAVLKDGTQVPLGSVVIQAIAAPQASAAIAGGNDTMGGASSGMPSSNNPGTGYPSAGSGRMGSGNNSGAVGQVGSTVGGVANTAGNTAGTAAGTTTATAGAAAGLNGSSRGVVNMPGLSLSAGNSTQGSVIASDNKNVKLDGGTEMVLKVQ
jgi:hypothetical protein